MPKIGIAVLVSLVIALVWIGLCQWARVYGCRGLMMGWLHHIYGGK